ncbi:MAG: ribbon-helix-helix protein, CopG family [Mesorhizobium sp.]|nr:MAG: ribbon-helix-helix protein, CopG family [Mesorhizobium sp.]
MSAGNNARRLFPRIPESLGAKDAVQVDHRADLRNVSGVPLEPATADTLDSIAAEMGIGRSDLIQIVLREWLETNAYLPLRAIDEESETDGSA